MYFITLKYPVQTHIPKIIGKNCVYVICWIIAPTNLRDSWYNFSSDHQVFPVFSLNATKLWNLKNIL